MRMIMKLNTYKLSLDERIWRLVDAVMEFLSFGRIWIVDKAVVGGHYWGFEPFSCWINSIIDDIEDAVKGYWQAYSFEK